MSSYSIINADVLDGLAQLDDGSVQTCVTSPPYWGLRDYGTGEWEGGDAECDHKQGRNGSGRADGIVDDRAQRNRDGVAALTSRVCAKCGARRVDRQLGLERTPGEYVERMVGVFREVRRVLRDDGTLWLNLGDSYAGGKVGRSDKHDDGGGLYDGKQKGWEHQKPTQRKPTDGFKPKDLVGIPWRVAFALQADGWYLRQDIIWAKPNPMPESVKDRCTKSHEYIFLLSKSQRYYYDYEAVQEDTGKEGGKPRQFGASNQIGTLRNDEGEMFVDNGKRNKRDVWTVTVNGFKEAHFATFPEEIPRTCILAGSKKGDTILDPFSGAGTTGVVAEKLDRKYIGIELNPQYTKLAEDRIWNVQPLFAGVNT